MAEAHTNLIYDVGLCDGGDTAYYLFRGYNVVAIDANPQMIDRAKQRFAKELRDGRLTLLNVGVSDAPGTATFWVSEHPEWSSFDRRIASRDGTPHIAVPVATLPFAQILQENGLPHYLKIDIEGNDRLCVEALSGTSRPRFISVESECVGEDEEVSEEQAVSMLNLLLDLGYRQFKLVKQGSWTPVRSSSAAQFGMRLLTSLGRGRLRMAGLSKIADKYTDLARIESLGFEFCPGSSGPFGDDIPGGWMTYNEARTTILRERRAFVARGEPLHSFWYDWHATF